mmetsp:Transcript_1208/g.2008  ORF Transcript_1208/g.2008 Transcript_1208/m.2008 type:complete len:339 (+) Transcript_1208:73-1089(+)|eukprot:scaffold7000_cov156-Skeletonema_dohrnii-CCMP3373.AAC.9
MHHLLLYSHIKTGAERLISSGSSRSFLRSTYKRNIHASHKTHQAAAGKRNKDLFTPSPFKRSDKINIDDKFTVQRDLREGDNTYGIRRYLLLPRTNDSDDPTQKPTIIASINANKNILFGAQLHAQQSGSDEDYIADYFAACEPLLDIAKEDASINGQQVQALAALNGLCSWVTECLDRDGEGSEVLTSLLHGEQPNTLLDNDKEEQVENRGASGSSNRRARQNVKSQSAKIILNNESDRILMLDAIRAIATGIPRPGHSVVGQGTYRDGAEGWKSLAWEYSNLATVPVDASNAVTGLEEVSLYKSRDGEVAKIEHLASVEAGYLSVAGGAMARMFFV